MTEITQADREALAVAHDGRRDALARNLRDQEYDLSLFPPGVVSSLRALAAQRVKYEAEIEAVRGDLFEVKASMVYRHSLIGRTEARATAAEALLAEAREVIAPFAECVEQTGPKGETIRFNHVMSDYSRAAAFMERTARP